MKKLQVFVFSAILISALSFTTVNAHASSKDVEGWNTTQSVHVGPSGVSVRPDVDAIRDAAKDLRVSIRENRGNIQAIKQSIQTFFNTLRDILG